MPGYQPGQVDPAQVKRSLEMFSPASSSIGRSGYGGIFDKNGKLIADTNPVTVLRIHAPS
jgi:hypothetical protein